MIFMPDKLHFSQYDFVDVLILTTIGVFAYIGQIFLVLANKYAMASKMATFNNLEIVFTILADIFIFNYSFVETDILGI